MTLNEFLTQAYTWSDVNAEHILLGSALLPVVGTVLARIGKAGKTDSDGRFIASTAIVLAVLTAMLEVGVVLLAGGAAGVSPLSANLALLAAPLVCLAGTVVGIRLVFPLSQLGSVRTAMDLGALLLACVAILWLLSRFHWGVLFFGSLAQLLVIVLVTAFILKRLFRRAFGLERRPAKQRSRL